MIKNNYKETQNNIKSESCNIKVMPHNDTHMVQQCVVLHSLSRGVLLQWRTVDYLKIMRRPLQGQESLPLFFFFFQGGREKLFFSLSWCFGRAVVASKAFYLQKFVTLTALDYYFKDYFKPWVVQFLTFVAKQCWPKLCLLARAGTFAWQHYLIVYSGDTGKSFQLQKSLLQRWLGLWRQSYFEKALYYFRRLVPKCIMSEHKDTGLCDGHK